jgi:hypothetical protein
MRLVNHAHLKDNWMDMMIAHILHFPYQAVLRLQHFSIVMTLVRIHMCWHLDVMRLGGWITNRHGFEEIMYRG